MESRPNAIQIEARTLELALQKAALTLGVSQDRLAHEVIKDNSSGIMSLLTGRRVQISAWRIPGKRTTEDYGNSHDESNERGGYERRSNDRYSGGRGNGRGGRSGHRSNDYSSRPAPNRRAEPQYEDHDEQPTQTPRTPPRQLTPEELVNLKTELTEFFKAVVERIIGHTVNVTATEDADRLSLVCDDAELSDLLQKNSKLSEALEHLLRKKPRHLQQELPYRVFIDFGGVRRKREEELVQMAKDLSSKVHENKRPIVLNYRSPYERKVIHMALDKDDRAYTVA